MTSLLGVNAAWALVVVVAVPLVVVAAAELAERIRQRRSPFIGAVQILRLYALPAFAVWAILASLIDLGSDSAMVRVAASALVFAGGAAVLSIIQVLVTGLRERRRARALQAPPQLLLALPRLTSVLVIGWLLATWVWEVDLSGLLTALGVTSLVVSFALQDTLSGLASGVLLLSDQPFRTGDWIKAGDHEGVVVDINWRTSRIRDRNGDTIVVPNSELAGASIHNFSSPERLHRVVVPVQVAYANPPTLAKEMLLDAARSTRGVLTDPPPAVVVVQIDDPLMGYAVHLWVDDYAIAPRVASDFGSLVWYQSHRHEVPLPSPAQDLYLYDGAAAGSDRPAPSEIHSSLRQAPLLASIPDEDLDRLSHAGRPHRYAAGETVVSSAQGSRDLVVVVEGRAELVLVDAGSDPDRDSGSESGSDSDREVVVAEIVAPQATGLIEPPAGGGILELRAVTDCEIVDIDAAVAGEVGSRNADLTAALNRMTEIRRRRVERLLDGRAAGP